MESKLRKPRKNSAALVKDTKISSRTSNRLPAIFLLIIFSLTQSIPAGWSADSVATNEQGIQQPVVPVDAHIPGNPNVDISLEL